MAHHPSSRDACLSQSFISLKDERVLEMDIWLIWGFILYSDILLSEGGEHNMANFRLGTSLFSSPNYYQKGHHS